MCENDTKKFIREGEAPAEPQYSVVLIDSIGSAGASPSLFTHALILYPYHGHPAQDDPEENVGEFNRAW